MKITARHTYDADPATVYAMLTDADWLAAVAQRSGAVRHEADVDGDSTRLTVALPAPSQVQRFTGDEFVVHVDQNWGKAATDGGRSGDLQISVEKMPATMTGTATLKPSGERTVVDYDGDLEVRIPILGRKFEEAAAPYVKKVLDVQQTVGKSWLAKS